MLEIMGVLIGWNKTRKINKEIRFVDGVLEFITDAKF